MIRWADPDRDAATLAEIFFRSIREGPSAYTEAERHAWMPRQPDHDEFRTRISRQDAAVFERGGGPAGFMTVDAGGYIDMVFILPDHRGTGVFRALYLAIEGKARARLDTRLWTHASLMAEPAFRTLGFLVMEREIVHRDGQMLRRAKMEKSLR